MRLEGKVVVVTGASRGIGAGIARCMAREGAAVVVNYLRSEEQAYQVVKDIEISGRKALAIKADVGDYQQVKSMIDQAVGHFGKLDIVVSNAGISGGDKPLADTTPKEFFDVINNHLWALITVLTLRCLICAKTLVGTFSLFLRGSQIFVLPTRLDTTRQRGEWRH